MISLGIVDRPLITNLYLIQTLKINNSFAKLMSATWKTKNRLDETIKGNEQLLESLL